MNLLDRFFASAADSDDPPIRFGRYSDIYKKPERYEAWDKSLAYYENRKYLAAYREFFKYLGDDEINNTATQEENDTLYFTCYQGSKKITGEADNVRIKAEAKIADARTLSDVAFFRELLERNFELEYCRFALDPQKNLTIIFDTSVLNGSPYKLYYALREMALQADKQDDLLLERYSDLLPVNTGHTEKLPLGEKETKYAFARQEITQTLAKIKELQPELQDYPGGIAYLLLSLCYRLDYLLTPQGAVTDTLERIHRTWFAADKATTEEKNARIIKEFKDLLDRSKTAWQSEFYRIISTFGIVPAFGHERLVNIIEAELPVLDWYAEHGFPDVALAIGDYIVGHSLFSFALPKNDRDLFHLYYRIRQHNFFVDLGFMQSFKTKGNKLSPREITRAVKRIFKENAQDYLSGSPETSLLKFGNEVDFVRSYLNMMRTSG